MKPTYVKPLDLKNVVTPEFTDEQNRAFDELAAKTADAIGAALLGQPASHELRFIKTLLPPFVDIGELSVPSSPACAVFEAGRTFERTMFDIQKHRANNVDCTDGDGI